MAEGLLECGFGSGYDTVGSGIDQIEIVSSGDEEGCKKSEGAVVNTSLNDS
ncbi:conserved hypothetical protein [Ricinus communis]|uniref:Uncharacterized protein n=1 Tax=Ricinus communis TaxID=3988 RepID=B9R866_RICCO|nr:conserved hypothetical protein [Ricinus communis]